MFKRIALLLGLGAMSLNAQALLISVSGPNSSAGAAAEIIGAPASVVDDAANGGAENRGQQGFNEAQGVMVTQAWQTDGGGSLTIGTLVNSHMIFLNSAGNSRITHFSVNWTFDGRIIGVMSNRNGSFEAASSGELGAAGTIYPGSFGARGLERNDNVGDGGNDGYAVMGNTIRVGMRVTEPGDWIRVITAVPEPGTLGLLGLGLLGIGLARRNRSA